MTHEDEEELFWVLLDELHMNQRDAEHLLAALKPHLTQIINRHKDHTIRDTMRFMKLNPDLL